jgi:two-component system, NtrC family, response regulator AtoC
MERKDDATEIQGIARASRDALRIVGMWSGGHVVRDVSSSGSIVIGRAAEADLVLDHPSVSRRHATLHAGTPLSLEDHGSANGTFIDGQKVEPGSTSPIAPGMVVELGAAMLVLRGASSSDTKRADPALDVPDADPPMAEVYELIDVVAKSKLTVLLIGETGVGKEVLARRVHSASPRANQPFTTLNCAALVENLLESELFGHERGAFTGATHAKAGLVEAASGGTLFLDEVGELTPSTQAKLLRVLEAGEVTRVGAVKAIAVDVRFVCATNRSLGAMVDEGRFRRDLYFRLDGLTIDVPPLRERKSEIVHLARRFLEEAAADAHRSPPTLSPETIERLTSHDWPGNVRELKNVIARSLLFCKGDILLASELRIAGGVGESVRPAGPTGTSALALEEKRKRVQEALEKSLWNQTRAAALLGVTRRTLHNWLDELAIPRARGGPRSS